jgi:hypothetical protein
MAGHGKTHQNRGVEIPFSSAAPQKTQSKNAKKNALLLVPTIAQMANLPHNVGMKKNYSTHWYHDPRYAPKPEVRRCDVEGCTEEGAHKAPKDRDDTRQPSLREYHWFCLKHVTEFNKKWDYFSGMRPEEVERFQRESVTGHRPTWRMGIEGEVTPEALQRKLHSWMHGGDAPAAPPRSSFRLKPKYRKALAVLGLEWPITQAILKKTFKMLAKQTHPDLHPNQPEVVERFREVTQAYHTLQEGLISADID